MNILAAIPPKVRAVLYVLYAVAGPLLVYTNARGWTGEAEYTLWVGLGAALGLTAAANTRDANAVTVTAPKDATVTVDRPLGPDAA